jgi:hypothetical protein
MVWLCIGFGKISCYKFREYFRTMIANDMAYYPEYLGSLIFINTPWYGGHSPSSTNNINN